MKARGDRVVHGLRGKGSNRRLPEAMKARAVKLFLLLPVADPNLPPRRRHISQAA